MFKFLFIVVISIQTVFSYEFRQQVYFADFGFGLYSMKSDSGLSTSFKVGKNMNDQLSLYYFDLVSFDIGSTSFYNDSSYFDRTGLYGIGSTYYLSPTISSIYLMGGLGVFYFNTGTYAESTFSRDSLGYMLGAGYETGKNHFELTLFSRYDRSSVQFTMHKLIY